MPDAAGGYWHETGFSNAAVAGEVLALHEQVQRTFSRGSKFVRQLDQTARVDPLAPVLGYCATVPDIAVGTGAEGHRRAVRDLEPGIADHADVALHSTQGSDEPSPRVGTGADGRRVFRIKPVKFFAATKYRNAVKIESINQRQPVPEGLSGDPQQGH
jgi:hypothetical protein